MASAKALGHLSWDLWLQSDTCVHRATDEGGAYQMNAEWILLPSLGNSPLPASCGLAHWWLCPILELCYYEVLSLLGNSTYTEILFISLSILKLSSSKYLLFVYYSSYPSFCLGSGLIIRTFLLGMVDQCHLTTCLPCLGLEDSLWDTNDLWPSAIAFWKEMLMQCLKVVCDLCRLHPSCSTLLLVSQSMFQLARPKCPCSFVVLCFCERSPMRNWLLPLKIALIWVRCSVMSNSLWPHGL